MSTETLREAANVLRERAESVTAHNGGSDLWFDADVDLRNAIRGTFLGNKKSAPDDAQWIALMTPTLGLTLADLLETLAFDREVNGEIDGRTWDHNIVPLARLILGRAS